jgi:predicted nucleotidyltransferase
MHPDPKILDDLVRRIVEVAHPRQIILFGSAARGDMGPQSDIDVLVVVPDGTHRRHTAQKIYQHLIGLGGAVDVVVATESDLQQYGNNFSLVYYPALREGRPIYAA